MTYRTTALSRSLRCHVQTERVVRVLCHHRQFSLSTVIYSKGNEGFEFKPKPPNYQKLASNLEFVKKTLGNNQKLTLAEKILYSHHSVLSPQSDQSIESSGVVVNEQNVKVARGETYLKLSPDRVAMQDASAQMALLQFMLAGLDQTAVPSSIHCDHLIRASQGPEKDLEVSKQENKEVFKFLESAAKRYGIDFWKPGSGIIHQIVLENYAMPGMLLLGTDSHTPNGGGLGTLAIGVGGGDAVDAMVGVPWELKAPKVFGIKLNGKLNGWVSPKDVVLNILGQLSVKGGTGYVIEYFGEGVESLSCTGMATICNMGAEMGATSSIFPYNKSMSRYLVATGRKDIASIADNYQTSLLTADAGCFYDKVIEINLDELEPCINGPFTPDRTFKIGEFADAVKANNWPENIKAGLVGSCTNSSYEDMSKASSIAKQALDNGINVDIPLLLTPGSTQIQHTIQKDGIEKSMTDLGAMVLANACGPCIGQWKREDISQGEDNIILSSYNRNFASRNDGNSKTMNFLASPEIVIAMSISGKSSFNPLTDEIIKPDGTKFKFAPPHSEELPVNGFSSLSKDIVDIASEPQVDTDVVVSSDSARLQALQPFNEWTGKDFTDMPILIKVQGKCTTDHISAAGVWLKYKGHLENISENTLIGAKNQENGKINNVYSSVTNTFADIPRVAKEYKNAGMDWLVIGDENYGEGSAREHAAMQVRFLGGKVVVCKSFARIHETNLKKNGVLPLTFVDPLDYDKIHPRATISTKNVYESIKNGAKVCLSVKNPDGSVIGIPTSHTMNETQVDWFITGSALNSISKEYSKTPDQQVVE